MCIRDSPKVALSEIELCNRVSIYCICPIVRSILVVLPRNTNGKYCKEYAPVSYTHLDVYKRQLYVGAPFFVKGIDGIRRIGIFDGKAVQ